MKKLVLISNMLLFLLLMATTVLFVAQGNQTAQNFWYVMLVSWIASGILACKII